jgi:hypothetical protein
LNIIYIQIFHLPQSPHDNALEEREGEKILNENATLTEGIEDKP